jgi:hypothetical protein
MKYSEYFETKKRQNDTFHVCLKDDSPQELKTLMFDIHLLFDALPNDWIYLITLNAFEELEDNDFDDIAIEADPYYHDLYKWFGEPFATALCAEVKEEFGPFGDIHQWIASAQWLALDKIYRAVDDFMHSHKEIEE